MIFGIEKWNERNRNLHVNDLDVTRLLLNREGSTDEATAQYLKDEFDLSKHFTQEAATSRSTTKLYMYTWE